MSLQNLQSVSRRNFLVGSGSAALAAAACAVTPALADTGSAKSYDELQELASVATVETVNAGSGVWPWTIPPAPITDIAKTYDADVVVGSGMAGMATALSAAKNGASVVVIERSDNFSVRGADIAAIGSKFQIAENIEIDRKEVFRLFSEWTGFQNNMDLLRLWIFNSTEMMDELIDIMDGYNCKPVQSLGVTGDMENEPTFYRQYMTAHSFTPKDKEVPTMYLDDGRWAMTLVGDALCTEATNNGAEFFFNTLAEQLVQDESGTVVGVIAQNEAGEHVQFNASKGVVMCTGDFSGNDDMLAAYSPICLRAPRGFYNPYGCNDGSGAAMSLWAGAAFQHGPSAPMIHAGGGCVLNQWFCGWLMVNLDGKRFCNETPNEIALANARLMQRGSEIWSIFDASYEEDAQRMLSDTKHMDRVLVDGLDELVEEYIETGVLMRADTLEELAELCGIDDVDTFVQTVNDYNELVAAGEDTVYYKDAKWLTAIDTPPYYATRVPANLLVVEYGLNCDAQLRVCNADDQPIPGLYAAGNAAGNMYANDYPLIAPGISHGAALTFGREVGKALATGEPITINKVND